MKTLIAMLVVLMIGFAVAAQDGPGVLPLDKLGPDLSTLFGGIGDEILTNMNQITLAGNTIGAAELGRFPHFSVDLLGIGVTAFNGIGSVLENPDTVWQFEALPLPDLLESNIGGSSIGGAYEAVRRILGLPTLRGNFGVGVRGGIEILGSVSYLSDRIIFTVVEPFVTLPEAMSSLSAHLLNIHLGLRKVIISERGLVPALSVSLGVAYADTGIVYEMTSLADILGEPIDLLGSNLDLSGDFSLTGRSAGVGIDLNLSKSFLYVFVPFLRFSTCYHFSSYNVGANFTASQTNPGESAPSNTFDLDIGAANSARDLSFYVTTGIELKLLFLVLHASIGANLQGLSLTVGDAFAGNFDATDVNRVNLNVGVRIQI